SFSLLLRRVRPSGRPFGLTGWRPPDDFPSPPPCGWSTGFMATPRTLGRLPFHRMRPALPRLMLDCSALPTSPTVARHRTATLRLAAEQLDAGTGRPGHLGPTARPQLHRVDDGAHRDVPQRKVVAGLDVRGRARLHPVALAEVLGRDDVPLLAVGVVQQRDPGGAV